MYSQKMAIGQGEKCPVLLSKKHPFVPQKHFSFPRDTRSHKTIKKSNEKAIKLDVQHDSGDY
jgi:hypothetical protein